MNATITTIRKVTLNFFDPSCNSNKVWIGTVTSDGKFIAEWGRVLEGSHRQSKTKQFPSISQAENELDKKIAEKLAKGYRYTETVDEGASVIPAKTDLKLIATEQIKGAKTCKTTGDLVEYLVLENIHQICDVTSIKYNSQSGQFRTPLGVLNGRAIATARNLLNRIYQCHSEDLVTEYFRLVPKDFGMKIPSATQLLTTRAEIQEQEQILDALQAVISASLPTSEKVFECSLTKVPASTSEGRSKFRKISKLFESTKNPHHQAYNYQIRRVYQVDMPTQNAAYDKKACAIGNVKPHWHGTSTANLLSILKGGLIIPTSACNGRMFGHGIYGSECSTKALNYSVGSWAGKKCERVFALLCDFAMGREYKPTRSDRNFPVRGYHSTYVSPGCAGVINQESIVYDVAQVRINYLVEFEY
jgi:poly [ADP-ribose] polymerase